MRLRCLLCCLLASCSMTAQVHWSAGKQSFDQVGWENYSTSFIEPKHFSTPIIVSAIPYNGVNSNFSDINTDLDITFDSSLFRFRSNFSQNSRQLYTYDSSEVYFLAPGVFRSNAREFEFRLLLNGKRVIRPWGPVTQFADSSFDLNNFQKGMAFLGGYKTDWDNFITVELKRKDGDTLAAAAVVYWKQLQPELLDIYTASELNSFLARLKQPYGYQPPPEDLNKWKTRYSPAELQMGSGLPRKLILTAKDDNIVFYINGTIFKREALEYQVIKDGNIFIGWRQNDFDNNFIWLKNLPPADYSIQIRFRSQRHNLLSYPFLIRPEWFQTGIFRIGMILLTSVLLVFIAWAVKQKQRTRLERFNREKINLELKALRSQLNPHFLFNALSSIQGLVNKNETEAADHYLSRFGSLLRETLKNSESELVLLKKELELLETYISLEQLRFHFFYKIEVDQTISSDQIEIPSLLLQPLIENAIKHGIAPKYKAGELRINILKSGKDLRVDIIDNGRGFDPQVAATGFGLKFIRERLRVLNAVLDEQKIVLKFGQPKSNTTIVHLIFENWI